MSLSRNNRRVSAGTILLIIVATLFLLADVGLVVIAAQTIL